MIKLLNTICGGGSSRKAMSIFWLFSIILFLFGENIQQVSAKSIYSDSNAAGTDLDDLSSNSAAAAAAVTDYEQQNSQNLVTDEQKDEDFKVSREDF